MALGGGGSVSVGEDSGLGVSEGEEASPESCGGSSDSSANTLGRCSR